MNIRPFALCLKGNMPSRYILAQEIARRRSLPPHGMPNIDSAGAALVFKGKKA
jgi:hypothetical protein